MLKDKVVRVIRGLYPSADTNHLVEADGRVTGYVVADEFRDIGSGQRVDSVWDGLTRDLGPDATRVGFLLFLSPEEAAQYASPSGTAA